MMTMAFLMEWAFRSSILILSGGLLLWALRVKDPAVRLAAWTAMLVGSLGIPLLSAVLPKTPVALWSAPAQALRTNRVGLEEAAAPNVVVRQAAAASAGFDWMQWGVMAYLAVATGLLLRLSARVGMSGRLLRGSRATGRTVGGTEIRESDQVSAPVTLGIFRSTIVVPGDWREWEDDKWNAVVAHERSHIARRDPAVQMLSAIHCALVWHSPLSWFLNRRIVRVAEEASDDAAVEATRDRATYAELLLEFMQRGVRSGNWQGVAMARYGRPDERIHRILDGTALSRGVTRWSAVAILALGSPLAYLAASAQPQSQVAAPQAPSGPQAPTAPRGPSAAPAAAQAPRAPQAPAAPQAAEPANQSGTIRRYMIFMGDSQSGSWDSRDPVDEKGLRDKFGRHFAWFRQAGNEYVVTDSGVLAELEEAMEPQREVNRMQDRVNGLQDKVNLMQNGVNAQQDGVNALQQQVNKSQDLVNRIQDAAGKADHDALIRELEAALRDLRASKNSATQESVNQRQSVVNEAQARVNAEQNLVNAEQHKVNDAQHSVSAEYSRRIQDILNAAVRRHVAQQLM
jgi:hypothetical protein